MEITKNIAAVVVVYNQNCADSVTCQALAQMEHSNLQVLIYDNSTKEYGNRAYCQQLGWQYLGGNGNEGISKAYNCAIDALKREGWADILCLFDDDTAVDKSYFHILSDAANADGGDIFVPMIYSAGRLLSPCRISEGYKTRLFQSEQQAIAYRGRDITAINSGMAIDLRIFDSYRYDEHIFLDGVDHHFMQNMQENGYNIQMLPYRCDHEFSGDIKPSFGSALNRFQIYSRDYSYILRNNKAAYCYIVGKRALHLAMQYKSLRFLSVYSKALKVE